MVSERSRPVRQPDLEARGIRLRALQEADYQQLYALATSADTGFRWRFRGATPAPDAFMRETWEGVFAQFAVDRSSDGALLGHVTSYGANPRDSYIYIAGISFERGTGSLVFAVAIFIEYLFMVGGFRRIYMEVPGFNFAQIGSRIHDYFPEDVVLPDREWYDDRYWDVHLLGCPRDHWFSPDNRLRRFVVGPDDTEAGGDS